MADNLTRLRTTLEQLHRELDKIESTDPEIQALLASAVSDIQEKIEGQEGRADEVDESIADRLTAVARHYEESHPTLSGIVGSIIDALSRMGI